MRSRKNNSAGTQSDNDTESGPKGLAGRLDEHDALTVRAIIESGIQSLYQPVVDVARAEILGYECLSRGPDGHELEPPLQLFSEARDHGLLPSLETSCRGLAVERFVERQFEGKLFLNCDPHAFLDPEYPRGYTLARLQAANLDPEQVVVELTAHHFREDFGALREAMQHYRRLGMQTAIPDLGTGYNGLRLWSELHPDFVKLDPHFAQNIHQSHTKQSFVRALVQLCDELRTRLVLTGIETAAEAELLQELGVHLMQGFYFAHPKAGPASANLPIPGAGPRRRIQDFQQAIDLAHWVEPAAPNTQLGSLWRRFENEPQCQAIPVVDAGKALGFIERARVYELFAKPYGRALFSQKTARHFVAPESLLVDQHTLLSDLSRMITAEPDLQLRQHFIVLDCNNRYLGVGQARDLLRRMTEHRLRVARHANPLTHLPGNVPTNEHLEDLINRQRSFSIAYLDLDAFKPFNDTWGYHTGDQVILLVAQLLRERLRSRQHFIGHIGGDDFVVISTHHEPEPQLRLLQQTFVDRIRQLMTSSGLPDGDYQAPDRQGEYRHYSLPRVSIGIVHVDGTEGPQSMDELVPALTRAKHESKRLCGQGLYRSHWHPAGSQSHA